MNVKSAAGLNLDVELYKSDVDSSRVVIVSTAFGAHIGYNLIYRTFADAASKRGYNVLLYSYTGSGNSEGRFQDTTLLTQIDDLMKLINHARMPVGAQRIYLLGHSLGASVSIGAYVADKGLTGAKDISAILSWNSSLSTEGLYRRYAKHYSDSDNISYRHVRPITGEEVISGRAMWRTFHDNNPSKNISEIEVPFYAVFGEKDELIQADNVRETLKRLSRPAEYIIIPNADHEFMNGGTREEVIRKTLDWLDTH